MSCARGVGLALGSVLLVSGAQLGMRWGMRRLPSPEHWSAVLAGVPVDGLAVAAVMLAVLAYVLSLFFWLAALEHLPLGRAYSLLSISYVLVYFGAAWLPGFGEPITAFKTLGVALVIAGVLAINLPRRTTAQRS